jgi:hypothetical protein
MARRSKASMGHYLTELTADSIIGQDKRGQAG